MAKKSVTANRSVKVERLRIVHEHDSESQPEMSGDPDYDKEDRERIASWRRDEWSYIGIYVECDLIVAGTVQHIRTAGLWGIETDSGSDYFQEIAEQEYDELLAILEQLGVEEHQVPPLASAKKIDR